MEFFDVLYLGIFIILSSAFDNRFYVTGNPPANVVAEIAHARQHFYSLSHIFSKRFIIVLEGEAVAYSYILDRMLAEFAAAAINLSKAIDEQNDKQSDGEEADDGVTTSSLIEMIEGILKESHFEIFPYYSRCLVGFHKHFTWTGPKLQILPRSPDILSIIPLMTYGERLELPSHRIYSTNIDTEPSDNQSLVTKRRDQADTNPSDEMPRKRVRVL